MKKRNGILRLIELTGNYTAVFSGSLTAIMTVIVGYSVVMRYLVGRPIGWSEEACNYIMVWAVFVGVSYTLKEEAHIRVDFLLSRVHRKVKWIFDLLSFLLGLVFSSVLFLKGIELVKYSVTFGDRSIATGFPLFVPQTALPVGAFLLFIQFAVKTVNLFLEKQKG